MSALRLAEQLAFRIGKLCNGRELAIVFAALEMRMADLLQQITYPAMRNRIAVRLVHMILSLPVFYEPGVSDQPPDIGAISSISDDDGRVAAILIQVRAVVGLSPPLTVDAWAAPNPERNSRRKALLEKFTAKRRRLITDDGWGLEGEITIIDQMTHRLLSVSKSQPAAAVLASLAMAINDVLTQLPGRRERDFQTLFVALMLLSQAGDEPAEPDAVQLYEMLRVLPTLPHQEDRTTRMLAWLRVLVNTWVAQCRRVHHKQLIFAS